MKTLRAFALFSLLAVLGCRPVRAQFIGYTFPQTVTATLANGVACTGSAQTFSAPNLGQTVHFATIIAGGTAVQTFTAFIQGVDAGGNTAVISDVGTLSTSSSKTTVSAIGYYTQVQVVVQCTPASTATFVINYVGTSSSTPTDQGQALSNRVTKLIANQAPAGTSIAEFFVPPYATELGYLTAKFITAAGPAGSTIVVSCADGGTIYGQQTFPLATTVTALQVFPVANFPCPSVTVQYVAGGSSTGVILLAYNFTPPGFPQNFAYSNITTSTSTVVKTGPGLLHAIAVNKPGTSATATIFDNTACSGTTLGTFSIAAAGTQLYDANFNTGLCITTTGAPDLTVSFN